jgi:DNA-binding transcriptional ArsR family regulator
MSEESTVLDQPVPEKTAKPRKPKVVGDVGRTPKRKSTKGTLALASSERIREVATLFKHISDPTRLNVLMILSEKDHNAGDMIREMGSRSQPAVSHHLALLRHAKIIDSRRQNKNNIYTLTDQGRKLVKAARNFIE